MALFPNKAELSIMYIMGEIATHCCFLKWPGCNAQLIILDSIIGKKKLE